MTVATRPAPDFAIARKAMVDSQLRTSGVNEPWVIARMAAVPREDFVPDDSKAAAYIDRAIALGDERMLAAPLVYGRMLAEAKPAASDKALVVDGGSGYLPALLETLVASVEVVSPAEAVAASRKRGNFTLLLVDGAIEEFPDVLAKRLADDGRVVTGLMSRGVSRLAVGRKAAGTVALLPLAEIGIPRLAEFDKVAGWSF
ncbi:protein-L-isoaspartate O-methyltransferase family protein [Tsuneonella mangrovi]|uniref:protein-L-isoaspartate O-methyltransferase family protein n=1 Tax=Tsuneonella mangrovi TaxID=1982042 RepID=UPI001F0A1282|nr:protein-L-isoaspartate O-methyltransferase [Tsuneonella mangrovi]